MFEDLANDFENDTAKMSKCLNSDKASRYMI